MNRSPKATRELLSCPSCGADLRALAPRRLGDLYADPIGDTFWRGQKVRLSPAERIVLHSILTAREYQSRRDRDSGHFVPRITIAERADISIGALSVTLTHIRNKFRQVDPDFNHIENEAGGYRWSLNKVPRPLARSERPVLIVYDNHEVHWRNKYVIQLSEQEAKALVLLIEARGARVSAAVIGGVSNHYKTPVRLGYELVRRLRIKFAAADDTFPVIVSTPNAAKNQAGFSLYQVQQLWNQEGQAAPLDRQRVRLARADSRAALHAVRCCLEPHSAGLFQGRGARQDDEEV